MRRAAKAPVASCWLMAVTAAALPEAEAEAEADTLAVVGVLEVELADDAADELAAAVEEAAAAAAADVAARASAVALRVPHCSLDAQVACPWASLGWLLTHWI